MSHKIDEASPHRIDYISRSNSTSLRSYVVSKLRGEKIIQQYPTFIKISYLIRQHRIALCSCPRWICWRCLQCCDEMHSYPITLMGSILKNNSKAHTSLEWYPWEYSVTFPSEKKPKQCSVLSYGQNAQSCGHNFP